MLILSIYHGITVTVTLKMIITIIFIDFTSNLAESFNISISGHTEI